jgi:hypothetical protein
MNALISLKPSRSETKSSIWAIDNALPSDPCGANVGKPSKKNPTGTCRIWDICCNLLAPMRLAPLSYFCTCWKVRPSAAASFSWLIASIRRRIRTRAPTCLSVGFAMTDPLAKAISKNRPDAGTFDIPIQRAIFGRRSVRIRLIGQRPAFFGQSFE